WGAQWALLSGLSGRAAFLELAGNPVDQQALRLHPEDDRAALIKALSLADSEEEFSKLLRATPITHLLETQEQPWRVHPPECLTRAWSSPQQKVVIWQVISPSQS
ncbi:MAG: hypothetical protein ABI883_06250, partial [Chthoniobacterales bacterium]